jgi:hypothetical protein
MVHLKEWKRTLVATATIAAVSLAGMSCAGLSPGKKVLRSELKPTPEMAQGEYAVKPDGEVVYDLKGLKISVKPLTDEQLNKMFPERSYKKEASTNPYTYGNWVDPDLGYTPNRFTVFLVKVQSITYPKVNLDPAQVYLETDRGDILYAYGRDDRDGTKYNFESYYMALRGASGVEKARFEERLGIVRQTLYVNGPVFKGDLKEGFLVFDPLDPKVKRVTLVLKDFVLEYSANDWPSKKEDIKFVFDRVYELKTLQPAGATDGAQ